MSKSGLAGTDALSSDEIMKAFEAYRAPVRDRLWEIRALILALDGGEEKIGGIVETLKWGRPGYLPSKSRVGSTIRLGSLRCAPDVAVLFFHCQSRLVETFRHLYPDTFAFEGNRALLIPADRPLPEDEIRHCVSLALTYHLWK